MIVLLAELFLDGRLSIRPERAEFLVEILCRTGGRGSLEELWTPWKLPARAGGLQTRKRSAGQLGRFLEPVSRGICLLGDAIWNRVALESGRVGEIRIRWLPEFSNGDADSFVSGYEPPEGRARLPLRLIRWRKARDGAILARYAIL